MNITPGPWFTGAIESQSISVELPGSSDSIHVIGANRFANAQAVSAIPELLKLAKEMAAVEKMVAIFSDKLPKEFVDVITGPGSLGEMARKALEKTKGK